MVESVIDWLGQRVTASLDGSSVWVVSDLHGNVAAALTADGSSVVATYRNEAS